MRARLHPDTLQPGLDDLQQLASEYQTALNQFSEYAK
jgi:hypothetical protein